MKLKLPTGSPSQMAAAVSAKAASVMLPSDFVDRFVEHVSKGQPDVVLPVGPSIVLKSGRVVSIEVLQPHHAALLKDFYGGLSEDSLYTRFHQAMPKGLSDRQVEYLSKRDGMTRAGLVALDPESGKIVGVVEYALGVNPSPGEFPEVAVTVDDQWQSMGLGSQLLSMLANVAFAAGFKGFDAEVLHSNFRVFKALKHLGNVSSSGTSVKVMFDRSMIFGVDASLPPAVKVVSSKDSVDRTPGF